MHSTESRLGATDIETSIFYQTAKLQLKHLTCQLKTGLRLPSVPCKTGCI
jgi:hypothetical protein